MRRKTTKLKEKNSVLKFCDFSVVGIRKEIPQQAWGGGTQRGVSIGENHNVNLRDRLIRCKVLN